jgi:hypothetical protein
VFFLSTGLCVHFPHLAPSFSTALNAAAFKATGQHGYFASGFCASHVPCILPLWECEFSLVCPAHRTHGRLRASHSLIVRVEQEHGTAARSSVSHTIAGNERLQHTSQEYLSGIAYTLVCNKAHVTQQPLLQQHTFAHPNLHVSYTLRGVIVLNRVPNSNWIALQHRPSGLPQPHVLSTDSPIFLATSRSSSW